MINEVLSLNLSMEPETFAKAETLWTKGSSCLDGAQVLLEQALASEDKVKPGHTLYQISVIMTGGPNRGIRWS